jgi:flagellar capping protein FliD
MSEDTKTIAERIDSLSRRTNAPSTFVRQVRTLFSSKGISLEEDSTPYLTALEQAFRREESIRRSTLRTRRNLTRVQKNFSSIMENYRKQFSHLERIKRALQNQSTRMAAGAAKGKGKKPAVVVYSSNPRAFVTRQEKDEMPMVPGPEELQ